MNTIAELNDALDKPMPSTEIAAENAIAIYLAAKAQIDAYQTVANAAKERLTEIIEETGQLQWKTRAGVASMNASAIISSYDTKALDALCASNDDIQRLLAPHRKHTERAGTLRITSAK